MYNTHHKLKLKCHRKYNFVCQYCGREMKRDYERYLAGTLTRKRVLLTVDHIVPLSRGGKWELSNLITACEPCNKKKADQLNMPTIEIKAEDFKDLTLVVTVNVEPVCV